MVSTYLLLFSALFQWTNCEGRIAEGGAFSLTPNILNEARFLRLQQFHLRKWSVKKQQKKTVGPPVLICGEGVMGIALRNPFNGRIFASHREKDHECMQYVTTKTLPKYVTSLSGRCGVRSKKSIAASTTDFHLRVVISFDYEYLTEEDRIYDLTCSYSSKNISVGAFYETVNFIAQPLRNSSTPPKCRYSLRVNTLDGPRVQSAMIGQLVYHRWTCPSEEFAFKVYRCYIHNGVDKSYLIVNDKGCSIDEAILPHPTYDSTRGVVYTAAKAFRFPKSRHVFFNCMLSVCHLSDTECMREIPPRCPRTVRKRSVQEAISVEERLQHHQALLVAGNYRVNDPNHVPKSSNNSAANSDPVLYSSGSSSEAGPSVADCEPKADTQSNQWVYVLLTTNLLSIFIAAVTCSRAFKRRHSPAVDHQCT